MKVTVCGPNLRDQSKGQFHVHAADCSDLIRHAQREPEYQYGFTIDGATRVNVVPRRLPLLPLLRRARMNHWQTWKRREHDRHWDQVAPDRGPIRVRTKL